MPVPVLTEPREKKTAAGNASSPALPANFILIT